MPHRGYVWTFNPHSGGDKIPPEVQEETRRRILTFAEKHCAGKYLRLDIRFRGPLCYIDAFVEPDPRDRPLPGTGETLEKFRERMRTTPLHLCRLRWFKYRNAWSVAFFTYSSERYTPAVMPSGEWLATPEEGFSVGAVHLGKSPF
jgi:hypothetical protein